MVYQTCYKNYQSVVLAHPRYGLFLLLFFFYSLSLNATTDTAKTKSQYDINDPRNPDCPCHKYQKQAEEEFARKNSQLKDNSPAFFALAQLKKELGNSYSGSEDSVNTDFLNNTSKNIQSTINKDVVTNQSASVSQIKSGKYIQSGSGLSKPVRKKRLLYTKMKFRLYVISKNIRKVKVQPNYKVCFKWN